MHWELEGAFTGEISAPMLREFGVTHVILGHSERRARCDETDRTVNLKVRTALDQAPHADRRGRRDARRAQGRARPTSASSRRRAPRSTASPGVALRNVVLAYEPIWAIGTGENCEPAEADRVMATIRGCIGGLEETPILYGGSMNAGNVASYVAQPNVNGGLVGGASLDPESFSAIVSNAAGAR